MLKAEYRDAATGRPSERCDFLEFLDDLGRIDMLRLRVLLCVARQPHQHASHYAYLLGVDPSALCKVIRSMSQDGYYRRPHMAQGVLERKPSVDRRMKLLSLSPKGAELLKRIGGELGGLSV